jgi:hypothetical protein
MKNAFVTALGLAILAATPAAFATGPGSFASHGAGGTSRPVCWIAGQNAMRAVDLRNNGRTREEARRSLYIPTMGQEGGTPEWIVRDIIDPHLYAVYERPASEQIDPNAVGERVFRECQAKLKEAGARQ